MARRLASLLAIVVLGALSACPAALADGDPASDTLLGQNVFYPYSPPVPAATRAGLDQITTAAARAHFPIKVALIAAPTDLGVIPELFGKPQSYADFLDREISFNAPQPLLVVMSDGYGLQGMTAAAKTAAARLAHPSGSSPAALAQAATSAVRVLAAAEGHPLSAAGGSGSSSSNSTTLLLVGLIVAAALIAGALIVLRRRAASGGATRVR